MKFASREGGTSRTLAMTASGWLAGNRIGSGPAAPLAAAPTLTRTVHAPGRRSGPAGRDSGQSRTTTTSYNKGQEIFGPGRGHGAIYIVRSGCVRLYKALPDGRAINLALLGPNTVFTQEADPDGLSSGSIAVALVDSTVSVVDLEHLAELIARSPELASSVVQGMNKRISELQILTEQLLARDTSVRLATTLLTLARGFGRPTADGFTAITLPVTHQTLANMIGSNRVTVTRKLLELQERGVVRALGRNSIAVSMDKLLEHARAANDGDILDI